MRRDFRKRLEEAESFGEIFRVVKSAVQEVLKTRRAGLELILADLPSGVGAMHQPGSNAIIMNRKYLQALLGSSKTRVEINSHIFFILLHEYLHSLGVLDEEEAKTLSLRVIRETLGEDHPAYKIAVKDLSELRSILEKEQDLGSDENVEIVRDFDTDNTQYIA
ncbi:MAG: hypothetical protein J7L79_03710 [Thaumarchaeota archaeon]|nr:hypothetical protein [Nitrososphaerota archaeon]